MHENFPLTNEYPVLEWNGGNVHKIRKSIFHLMSGEIFAIQGKTFFVMGGASSHDKEWRIPGVSWWSEEIPSKEVMDKGLDNLKKYGNKVDYIITHCAPSSIQQKIKNWYKTDILTEYLNYIYHNVEFDEWFCGHYHTNLKIDKVNVLYNDIIKIL